MVVGNTTSGRATRVRINITSTAPLQSTPKDLAKTYGQLLETTSSNSTRQSPEFAGHRHSTPLGFFPFTPEEGDAGDSAGQWALVSPWPRSLHTGHTRPDCTRRGNTTYIFTQKRDRPTQLAPLLLVLCRPCQTRVTPTLIGSVATTSTAPLVIMAGSLVPPTRTTHTRNICEDGAPSITPTHADRTTPLTPRQKTCSDRIRCRPKCRAMTNTPRITRCTTR